MKIKKNLSKIKPSKLDCDYFFIGIYDLDGNFCTLHEYNTTERHARPMTFVDIDQCITQCKLIQQRGDVLAVPLWIEKLRPASREQFYIND